METPMATNKTSILTVPRIDEVQGTTHVILKATDISKGKVLEIEILATEGENAFAGTLTGLGISKERPKSFPESEQAWINRVRALILQDRTLQDSAHNKLELIALLSADSIQLRVRQLVAGINHTYHLANLLESDEEIPLFDWIAILSNAQVALNLELASAQAKLYDQQKSVESLRSQLNELTNAKSDHEENLLLKFQEILNAKKRRIRELTLIDAGVGTRGRNGNSVTRSQVEHNPTSEAPPNDPGRERYAPKSSSLMETSREESEEEL